MTWSSPTGWNNAGWSRPAAAGGAAPTISGGDVYLNEASGGFSPFTTPSLNIGTASSTRVVAVAVAVFGGGSSLTITAVSVGGVSLTRSHGTGNSVFPTDLWYGVVGTSAGASNTVAVTATAGMTIVRVGVIALDNVTATPTSTSSIDAGSGSPYNFSSALTVPATGFAVAFADWNQTGAFAWTTPIASDASTSTGTSYASIGHSSTAGSLTPQFTGTNSVSNSGVAATWGP